MSTITTTSDRFALPALESILKGWSDTSGTVCLYGGAARALHTGEEVNDYDFFCTTEEVREAFVSMLLRRNAVCVGRTFSSLNENLSEEFEMPLIGSSKQYDVIQVRKPTLQLDEWIKTTDMTAVQFVYMITGKERRFVATPSAICDSTLRRVVLHNVSSPRGTLARVGRMIAKGWQPSFDINDLRERAATAVSQGLVLKRKLVR